MSATLLVLAASLLAQSDPDLGGYPWKPAPPGSLASIADLAGLPVLRPGERVRQFASTDPSGRGRDHGHYLKREGPVCVLAEAAGPGVIERIWSANPAGTFRLFLDGEREPRVACAFADLFAGKVAPFAPPVTGQASGGSWSYHPIPFARSCRVEVADHPEPGALYYHVQVRTLPAGATVESFDPRRAPSAEDRAARDRWASPPALEEAARALGIEVQRISDVETPAGGRTTLTDLKEPGVIAGLSIAPRADGEALRRLVLRMWWDGATEPSVEVPLADFFGDGFGRREYRALALQSTGEGLTCLFPMPFESGAHLELENGNREAIPLSWAVAWRKTGPPGPSVLRFHAAWRQEVVGPESLYTILRARGSGKFVGTSFSCQGIGNLWYLEGNEELTVDGEARPSFVGTGTEDFFNGGWYWKDGPVRLPVHGLLEKDEATTFRTAPWRHLVNDAIPFASSLDARIEHGSSNEVHDVYYSSVAYWYQSPAAAPFARVPEAARLGAPRRLVVAPRGAIAAAAARASLETSGPVPVLESWERLSSGFLGTAQNLVGSFPRSRLGDEEPARRGGDVILFPAREVGDHFGFSFRVDVGDRWRVRLVPVEGPEHGRVGVAIDEMRAGELDAWAEETRPGATRDLGVHGLDRGAHRIRLEAIGAGAKGKGLRIGFCWLALESAAPFVRQWHLSPGVLCAAGDDLDTVYEAETAALTEGAHPDALGWRRLEAKEDVVDLNAVIRRAPAVVYAMTFVESPDARETLLRLGSDDGVKVWLNGRLAHRHAVHRSVARDQDAVPLRLERGRNRLLFKVRNDDGGYALMARLSDPDGALRVGFAPAPEAR